MITGGSKGIGRAIARGLAREGVKLVLIARNADTLEKTAEDIRKETGAAVVAARADITSTEQVEAAATAAKDSFGTVHIVVNNAGGPMRRIDRQILWPDSDWIGDLDNKILGALRITRAFLPLMPSDGTGRIINISGTASTIVWAPALTHALNNAAMNQATGYLATDLASQQITVNTVVPGLVGTEGRDVLGGEHGQAAERHQGRIRLRPSASAWGFSRGGGPGWTKSPILSCSSPLTGRATTTAPKSSWTVVSTSTCVRPESPSAPTRP